jgi:iron complex outermembrane recepter protein
MKSNCSSSNKRLLSLAIAGAIAASASPWAHGQGLEEIVVTARKSEERIQDVPLTITAFGARDIQERGIQDLYQVSLFTPGFQFEKLGNRYGSQDGGTRPVIRGMSSIGGGPNAAFFVDGILHSQNIMSFPFELIERVEVIKGPQSAQFGRSTFAGAINFITKRPTDEPEHTISARIAEYGDYEVNLVSRGPIIEDRLAYMVHARYYDFDGQHRNRFDGARVGQEESVGLNAALRFTPTDRLSINFSAGYNEDDDGLAASVITPATVNNCFLEIFRQYYCGVIPVEDTIDLDRSALNGQEGLRRETVRLMASVDYEFDNGMLLSWNAGLFNIDSEYGYDSDYISAQRRSVNLRLEVQDRSEWSTELRLASNTEQRVRWQAGLFYYSDRFDSEQQRLSGLSTLNLGRENAKNVAVFGSVSADITDTVTATLEARYAEDELEFIAGNGNQFKSTFDSILPRLTVDWKITDTTMLYGVVALGNKPGGFNTDPRLPPELLTVDEEEVWHYEVGAKNTFLDGQITMNLAAFYLDWSKQRLTETFFAPDASISYGINAGKTEVKGFEFDIVTRFTESFIAGFSYGLNDATFVRFEGLAEGIALLNTADVAGRLTPNTSKHEFTLFGRLDFPLGPQLNGFFRADYAFSESKYDQVFNLAETGDKSLLNVKFGIEGERWDASLYVDNVTNSRTPSAVIRYVDNKNTLPIGDSERVSSVLRGFLYSLADKRRMGVNFRYRF